MNHLLSGEDGGLYLLVLDGFVLRLVFRITHFVYIPLFLLSESNFCFLQGLRWSSF